MLFKSYVNNLVNDAKPLRTYEGAANALLEIFVKPYFKEKDYKYLRQNVISMPDFRTAHYKKLGDRTDRDYLGDTIAEIVCRLRDG